MTEGKMRTKETIEHIRDAVVDFWGEQSPETEYLDKILATQPTSAYERAVIEQAMVTECVNIEGRDPTDIIRDIISWHVGMDRGARNAKQPRGEVDGCTEPNCPRCLTAPHARGEMEHAGIGSYPSSQPKAATDAQPVAWFPTYANGEILRFFSDGKPVQASTTKENAEKVRLFDIGTSGNPVEPLYTHPAPSQAVATAGDGVTEEKKLFEAAYDEVASRPITIREIAWRMWQKRAALASRPVEAAQGGGVTEEMIDRAAKGMWDSVPRGVAWPGACESTTRDWRFLARAALTALAHPRPTGDDLPGLHELCIRFRDTEAAWVHAHERCKSLRKRLDPVFSVVGDEWDQAQRALHNADREKDLAKAALLGGVSCLPRAIQSGDIDALVSTSAALQNIWIYGGRDPNDDEINAHYEALKAFDSDGGLTGYNHE